MSDSLWPLVAHRAPLSMGILQARILEWVVSPSSRGSSQPRNWMGISCTASRFFTSWAARDRNGRKEVAGEWRWHLCPGLLTPSLGLWLLCQENPLVMLSHVPWIFMCHVGPVYAILGKISIGSSAHFVIGLFVFWRWTVGSVYVFWLLNPYWSYHLQILFPIL